MFSHLFCLYITHNIMCWTPRKSNKLTTQVNQGQRIKKKKTLLKKMLDISKRSPEVVIIKIIQTSVEPLLFRLVLYF